LAYLTSYGANAAIKDYDLNTVLSFLIPGCPKVDVYEGWYQTETIGTGTPDTGLPVQPNQIVVSNATYFIPDRAIYFECKLPGGDKIGEFVQGINLASGTIDNPGFGKFLVVDDCTAPGTRGGPSNPFVDLIGGVYGGAKLDRAFDTLTASV
jgi:hypothetical protein